MRVAVVEAVHEDLLEVGVDAAAGQLGSVDAGLVEQVGPVHRHALDALEREHLGWS